jgi:hypothetical protein
VLWGSVRVHRLSPFSLAERFKQRALRGIHEHGLMQLTTKFMEITNRLADFLFRVGRQDECGATPCDFVSQ